MSESTWAQGRPGLADAASTWLDELDSRLAEAERRADRILRSPLAAGGLLRFGQLAARAAPMLPRALVRRDATEIVRALGAAAARGGPTYVKIGQLISTTKGLTPDWVADAFAGCRDAVPPAPRSRVEETVSRSGVSVRSWDRVPIASASVAQVHAAVLEDGTDAVIKVRRPGIVPTVAGDMAWLLPALRVVESRNDRMRIVNMSATLELMTRLFAQEVDLRLEAANIAQMALAFERAEIAVQLPIPIPGMVTERVMVMERVPGVVSSDTEAVARYGHHANDLVRLAIVGTLNTTLTDGVFHGDLHPANVMVNDEGLALVDFGIVGRLTDVQRDALLELLVAAFAEDRLGIVRALHKFGALPPEIEPDEFLEKLPPRLSRDARRALRSDRAAIQERVTTIVRTLSENGFRVPPALSLFAKNLVYLADAVARHAPDFEMIDEVTVAVTALANRPA